MPVPIFNKDSFFASRPVMLAPMAGVNDAIFRSICKRMGATLTYTEMISAKGFNYGNLTTKNMLNYLDDEAPFAVQIFGNDSQVMKKTASELERRLGNSLALIDVNMGCPARKIAGKGEGAALMNTPQLAYEILTSIVGAVRVPVTVKFRKGFCLNENTALAFAQMAEAAGVAAVAVHTRTAKQYYQGDADPALIANIVAGVSIPVIASGDVYTPADIERYFSLGAKGVMVARGAQGNPWIFQGRPPSLAERIAVAREHAERLYAFDSQKLVSMRRHIAWYFKGAPGATALRRALAHCVCLEDYRALLDRATAQAEA